MIVVAVAVASARLLAVAALDDSVKAYRPRHLILPKQLPIHHPSSFPSQLRVAFPLI